TIFKKDTTTPAPMPMTNNGPPMPGAVSPPMPGAVSPPMPGAVAPPMPGAVAPPMPGAVAPPMPGTVPPAPPTQATAADSKKDYTSNPTYLSVTPELKKLLNIMEDDQNGSKPILMAEKFNSDAYPRTGVKRDNEGIAKLIDPVLNRTSFIGLTLAEFTT